MEQEEMMDRTADAEEIELVKELTECIVKSIKKIMIDRDINQRQLSQMACVSPSQLCHSFSGRRRFSFDLLTRIADALGFSITFSLEKKEDGKL